MVFRVPGCKIQRFVVPAGTIVECRNEDVAKCIRSILFWNTAIPKKLRGMSFLTKWRGDQVCPAGRSGESMPLLLAYLVLFWCFGALVAYFHLRGGNRGGLGSEFPTANLPYQFLISKRLNRQFPSSSYTLHLIK
jgi:hypothetical protein